MQLDLNILDCPICFDTLTTPIFQCDNGHLACSSCCPKLKDKCPSCALPIGHIRCRAMESVLGSIMVPCPNAKLGCTESFSYGKESSTHENECNFSHCSCPVLTCNYTGSNKNLYNHFQSTHVLKSIYQFSSDSSISFLMHINDKILTVSEYEMKLLFVLQCFREPNGVCVIVSCIAPPSPEVGEFSYCLSYTVDGHTINYESPEVKRVLQLTLQTPKENFFFIPNYLLRGDLLYDLKLRIKKLNKE